jgi:predicted ArsR family transcriptional regulator
VAGGRHAAGARVSADRTVPPRSASGRARVLELLRSASNGLGVLELAERSGLHANTVRFHLNRLVTAGAVRKEVDQHSMPGRPRLVFTALSADDVDSGQRNYQLLADMLAGFLTDAVPDPAASSSELGRAWGSYLATRPAPGRRMTRDQSLTELLRVLDDIGFSPLLAEGDERRVLLRHCPFREVAIAHREVVCSLHLGVMQGVLEAVRAPVEATHLQPFAEPSLCVARLAERSPSTPPTRDQPSVTASPGDALSSR